MTDYNVLVVCAAGMSSSLLESKTKLAAEAHGHGLNIHALSVSEISCYDFGSKPVDMVLVAPQVRYKKKSICDLAAPHGVVVQDIEPMTFGMVDGEKLFEQIVQAVVKEFHDAR
jgi:PTS system cellobiose-specific IIB component